MVQFRHSHLSVGLGCMGSPGPVAIVDYISSDIEPPDDLVDKTKTMLKY